MNSPDLRAITERLAHGESVALPSPLPRELPLPSGVLALRVRCGADQRILGPWRDLSSRAAQLLHEPDPERRDAPLPHLRGAPRHRMLGRAHQPEGPSQILRRLARLASVAPHGLALVFDDIDRADEATLALAQRILQQPEVFGVPLLLGLADPRSREARGLLATLGARSAVSSEVAPVEAPTSAHVSEVPRLTDTPKAVAAEPPPWRVSLAGLDADTLLTLRAASVLGDSFSVDELAALRERSTVSMLEHLQRAHDAGITLDDAGDGTLRMPDPVAAHVRGTLLPSLARAWHQRVAERLRARPQAAPAAPPMQPETPPLPTPVADDPAVRREPPHEGHHAHAHTQPPLPQVHLPLAPEDVFAPAATPRTRTPEPDAPTTAEVVKPPQEVQSGADSVRAARHLMALGDLEGAARQLFVAAREAVSIGLPAQALAHGRDAVALVGELPVTPERRRLRAEMLLALGTIRWQHGGPGADFGLRAAFDTLRDARAALGDKDATALRGAIVAAMAGVATELGDITALDAALTELSETTRALLAEGAAVEAARLLNDEAALLLRVGDPVQAAWLLDRSRAVFERQVASMDAEALQRDPTALMELAETDHLYARLPLHAEARPGREADALSLGREHARASLELYERLGDAREAARVRETLARLELRAAHPRRAEELLQECLHAQEAQGDVLGLARTAGALAEVAAQEGRFDEALQRLGDSLAFNVDKGSALGVAWNRRALARIADAVRGSGAETTTRAFDALVEQMERAEAIVGPVRLPSDEA